MVTDDQRIGVLANAIGWALYAPDDADPTMFYVDSETEQRLRSAGERALMQLRGFEAGEVGASSDECARLRELVGAGLIAFRLTHEYVGEERLPSQEGWAWFNWVQAAEMELGV